jgi:RNA recognition motif-containing protein
MSLFVGNISRHTSESYLEDEFSRFGKCKINIKGNFAFIDYTKDEDAEDAMKEL